MLECYVRFLETAQCQALDGLSLFHYAGLAGTYVVCWMLMHRCFRDMLTPCLERQEVRRTVLGYSMLPFSISFFLKGFFLILPSIGHNAWCQLSSSDRDSVVSTCAVFDTDWYRRMLNSRIRGLKHAARSCKQLGAAIVIFQNINIHGILAV